MVERRVGLAGFGLSCLLKLNFIARPYIEKIQPPIAHNLGLKATSFNNHLPATWFNLPGDVYSNYLEFPDHRK